MTNPLLNPNNWVDQNNLTPPSEWNGTRYEFLSNTQPLLRYIGPPITEPFNIIITDYNANSYGYATYNTTISVDGFTDTPTIDSGNLTYSTTIPPCTSFYIQGANVDTVYYMYDFVIEAGPEITPTPSPSPTLTTTPTPTITPTITPTPTLTISPTPLPSPLPIIDKKLKQLFRRYNDGKLVLKNETYDLLSGYQHIQSSPSNVWNIKHNLNSTNVIVQIYVNNLLTIAETIIIDSCNVQLLFKDNVAGRANLVVMDKNDRLFC